MLSGSTIALILGAWKRHRHIEDLFAERGITVSDESIRLWCIKFGSKCSRGLKRELRGFGDTFYIDAVFVKV
jgi:putative transposase